jgi:dephospho-CoA kinase
VTAIRRIGLTGDVGAGKSTVLAWMREQGAHVLDADQVVHRLLAEDADLIHALGERFGAGVLGNAGVDRAALGQLVFADSAALAQLEELVFPRVRLACERWLATRSGVAVFEAVKLVEAGMVSDFDALWLVTCARDVRRERLRVRGWSSEQIDLRIAAGGPLVARLATADEVIDNSGSLDATRRQLTSAWRRRGEERIG